jgi:CheY-like chemotaxis protein
MSKSRNIILVEDDLLTVQITNMVFKRAIPLAKVLVFENGLEATEWIDDKKGSQEDNFVLLLDLNMPVLDGWGFLNYFEKLDETTKQKFNIHILTSSVDRRDTERSKKHPFVKGFHSKPLTYKMVEEIFA